jgi:hypothetical protein
LEAEVGAAGGDDEGEMNAMLALEALAAISEEAHHAARGYYTDRAAEVEADTADEQPADDDDTESDSGFTHPQKRAAAATCHVEAVAARPKREAT